VIVLDEFRWQTHCLEVIGAKTFQEEASRVPENLGGNHLDLSQVDGFNGKGHTFVVPARDLESSGVLPT
jgi:hypothetical protein